MKFKEVIWASRPFLFGLSLRLLLAAGAFIEDLPERPEISPKTAELLRIREALFYIEKLELSPYTGNAYHGPPLLLPFLSPFASKQFYCIFPFIIADVGSALLLRKITSDLHIDTPVHPMYLYFLSPFSVLSCVGCSPVSLENFFIILSLAGAISGSPFVSAFGSCIATYLGLHPIFFIFSLIFINYQNSHGSNSHRRNKGVDFVGFKNIFLFIFWISLIMLLLLKMSSLYLSSYDDHRDHHILPSFTDLVEDFKALYKNDVAVKGKHWMIESYVYVLKVANINPNMGLFWYFFAEIFDEFRSFYVFVFHSACFIFSIPLCIRFPEDPVFVFFIQCISNAMLKPCPVLADYALYQAMLLLFPSLGISSNWWWFLGFSSIFIGFFEVGMYYEWATAASANPNFYYAATLLIGVWHILLLGLVLNKKVDNEIKAIQKKEK